MVGTARSVMVVEDHDFQRRLAVKQLEELETPEILEGANGREALNQLLVRERPVDVVLCDLDMPEMDGAAFIAQVALNKLANSVLVVSGLDPSVLRTVESMARAYGLQVLGAIPKPLGREQLSTCLEGYAAPGGAGLGASEATAEEARRGLERGEFIALYQPQVSLSDGGMRGVQVLARWFRPGQGVCPASEFIPLLERESLLESLLTPLLQQTCEQLRAWKGTGLDLDASLKLSAITLRSPRLPDSMEALVRDSGCDPTRITFQVIETGEPGERAALLNSLARLRIKGFGLALDDLGEGGSSLDDLAQLPFTELRVDRALLRESENQEWSLGILEASLGLARRLRMRLVAERVETQADWNAAKARGFERAQGYHISRPMPGHQIPDWTPASADLRES